MRLSFPVQLLLAASSRLTVGARRRGPDVNVEDVFIADLGRAFDGYTIAVLSDFHHAPLSDLEPIRRAVDVANAASVDLIALLGDYGWSLKRTPLLSQRWYREALTAVEPEFRRLHARDGLVAVIGNHDYYANASHVRDWLRSIGADVLVNQSRRIVRSTSVLRIAGMDDLAEGQVDASVGCDLAEQVPTIVLSHNPDGVMRLGSGLRVDLMLAGHTHGGQIVLPGYGAPMTMSRVCGPRSVSGWIPTAPHPLYVTRGLGAQIPFPFRINCPPEIVVLCLRSGCQQPA